MINLDNIRNFGADQRITFSNTKGDFEEQGVKPGNVFSRLVDWKNRSQNQIESNKTTANNFIASLKDRYGDQAANWATKQLSAHISAGRPLSQRRARIILDRSEQLQTKTVQGNTAHLNKSASGLIEQSLKTSGYDVSFLNIHQKNQLKKAVEIAIKNDPQFKKTSFRNPQQFSQHFQDTIDNAVKQFYADNSTMKDFPHLEALMPRGTIAEQNALYGSVLKNAFGSSSGVRDQLEMKLRNIVGMGETINDSEAVHNTRDMLAMRLQLQNIHDELSTGAFAQVHNDRQSQIIDAAKNQIGDMLAVVDKQLGIDTLDPADTKVLLTVFSDIADIESRIEDPTNNASKIYGAPEDIHETLEEADKQLARLANKVPEGSTIDSVIKEQRAKTESVDKEYRDLLEKLSPFSDPLTAIAQTRDVISGDFDDPSMTAEAKAKELHFKLGKLEQSLSHQYDSLKDSDYSQAQFVESIKSDVMLHRIKIKGYLDGL